MEDLISWFIKTFFIIKEILINIFTRTFTRLFSSLCLNIVRQLKGWIDKGFIESKNIFKNNQINRIFITNS